MLWGEQSLLWNTHFTARGSLIPNSAPAQEKDGMFSRFALSLYYLLHFCGHSEQSRYYMSMGGGHRQPPSRRLVGAPLLKTAKGKSRSNVGPVIVLNRVDPTKKHDWERLGLLLYRLQLIFSINELNWNVLDMGLHDWTRLKSIGNGKGPIVFNCVDTIKKHDWERLRFQVYRFESFSIDFF